MGTSLLSLSLCLLSQDHPHAYGDKLYKASAEIINPGSSPRVWGQAIDNISDLSHLRIIPTRMGTSLDKFGGENGDRDHPHAYGDKFCPQRYECRKSGSSPRVWGQASFISSDYNNYRIIPTRMGTSPAEQTRLVSRQDHPHAYGDKKGVLLGYRQLPGSSPRVWGQDHHSRDLRYSFGIIPTRMGTS